MKKIFCILFACTLLLCGTSCNKEDGNELDKQTTTLTISFELASKDSGESMTKSGDNTYIFDEFYAAIMDGRLIAPEYDLTFTEMSSGESFQLKGTWNEKKAIKIKMGTYTISGKATATGCYIQDKCSIVIYDKDVIIDRDDAIITLKADYDCALIIFADDTISSVENHTGEQTTKLFNFNNYIYAFVNANIYDSGSESYLLGTRYNGSQFNIPTNTLQTFAKGKYYIYDTSKTSFFESGFTLPQMEEGVLSEDLMSIKMPNNFDGKVDFELILSDDGNNTKAKIRFTPSEEVEQYCVWVITENMRQEVLPFLNNDEKYMQWFITSESGFNEGAICMTGAKEMWLGQDPSGQGNCFYFVDDALINTKNVFYAYIVAMGGGDKDGDGICDATLQTFERHEFKLGTPILNTPKVDVTVLESTPDKVRYHVKKSEDSSQIKQAYYIANCEREWLGTDLSIDLLFAYYGNPLSDEDVAMINTDEGLIIEIPTKPASPYFAMKLYNGEGYYSFTDIYNYILE